jgi:hypothetical protein
VPQPPKTDPIRRNPRVGPLMLPSQGRQGPPPPWPLPGKVTTVERKAWSELCATPQAVAWEKLGWIRTVARYCRAVVLAEASMNPQMLAQVTALEDRLGLTPKAMRLLLWQVVSDEVAEKRQESTGARGRIKAVG